MEIVDDGLESVDLENGSGSGLNSALQELIDGQRDDAGERSGSSLLSICENA